MRLLLTLSAILTVVSAQFPEPTSPAGGNALSGGGADGEGAMYVNGRGEFIIPEKFPWGSYAKKLVGVGGQRSHKFCNKNRNSLGGNGVFRNSTLGQRQTPDDPCEPPYILACPITDELPCCHEDNPNCCPVPSTVCCPDGFLCQGIETCCAPGTTGCGESCCDAGETCCGELCCSVGFDCMAGSCVDRAASLSAASVSSASVASVSSASVASELAESQAARDRENKRNTTIGAAVGGSIGGLLLVGAGILLLLWHHKKEKKKIQASSGAAPSIQTSQFGGSGPWAPTPYGQTPAPGPIQSPPPAWTPSIYGGQAGPGGAPSMHSGSNSPPPNSAQPFFQGQGQHPQWGGEGAQGGNGYHQRSGSLHNVASPPPGQRPDTIYV